MSVIGGFTGLWYAGRGVAWTERDSRLALEQSIHKNPYRIGFKWPFAAVGLIASGLAHTQRAQYPLIKEYSLNHNMNPVIV